MRESAVNSLKKCAECGSILPPGRQNTARYCSEKCKRLRNQRDSRRRKASARKKKTAVCIVCGKSFTKNAAMHVICGSKECLHKHAKAREQERNPEAKVPCMVCGRMFIREAGSYRRTCSTKCSNQAGRISLFGPLRKSDLKQHVAVQDDHAASFAHMQTGVGEFRSWLCPEMLPFDCSEYGSHIEMKRQRSFAA